MKKISENDKGIATMVLVIIVVAVIAVAAIGAYLVLTNDDNKDDKGLGTYTITYHISANIGEGQTVYVYLDGVQIDENSEAGNNRIIQATMEYYFQSSSDQNRTLSAVLKDADGNKLREAEYHITVEIGVSAYTPTFPLL